MPIEIRELVIRASVDRNISKLNRGYLERVEKEKLKEEVLTHCMTELRKTFNKNKLKPINR